MSITTTTSRRRSSSSSPGHPLLSTLFIIITTTLLLLSPQTCNAKPNPSDYQEEATSILEALNPSSGQHAGQAWEKLAKMTDTVGSRLCGSENLVRSVKYMLDTWTKDENFENVHREAAMVPHWHRGKEECVMLSPRHGYKLQILGLGTSVGTVDDKHTDTDTDRDKDTNTQTYTPLIAPVIVATSFDDLDNLGSQGLIQDKIVLLNYHCDWDANPISCYTTSAQYRSQGASRASQHGAIAYLVRSLASASIGSPHTGYQGYLPDMGKYKKIPAAAVTIEDADAMSRMYARGQNITLSLYMEGRNLPETESHNVVAEYRGSTYPNEVILLSGHLDSWDVGVGAMDDGGGLAISWQALSTLTQLGLRPKRTVRVVGWTCEEFGGVGARQYYHDHTHTDNAKRKEEEKIEEEEEKMICVFESDMGAFRPQGLTFTGSPAAVAVMEEVLQLLRPINASQLVVSEEGEGYETDTGPWRMSGVPGGSLLSENARYFNYHHSVGDQMNVLSKEEMDMAAALFAVVTFVLADLDEPLARNEERKEEESEGGLGGEEEGVVSLLRRRRG